MLNPVLSSAVEVQVPLITALAVAVGTVALWQVLAALPGGSQASQITLGAGILLAILLSFSRAAWGQFAFCAVLLMAITYATSTRRSERARIVLADEGRLRQLFHNLMENALRYTDPGGSCTHETVISRQHFRERKS